MNPEYYDLYLASGLANQGVSYDYWLANYVKQGQLEAGNAYFNQGMPFKPNVGPVNPNPLSQSYVDYGSLMGADFKPESFYPSASPAPIVNSSATSAPSLTSGPLSGIPTLGMPVLNQPGQPNLNPFAAPAPAFTGVSTQTNPFGVAAYKGSELLSKGNEWVADNVFDSTTYSNVQGGQAADVIGKHAQQQSMAALGNIALSAGGTFVQGLERELTPYEAPRQSGANIIGGAMKGAAQGSKFGPIGTGVGAVVGGITSAAQRQKQINEWNDTLKETIAKRKQLGAQQINEYQRVMSDYPDMGGVSAGPYAKYGGKVGNGLPMMAMGGNPTPQNPTPQSAYYAAAQAAVAKENARKAALAQMYENANLAAMGRPELAGARPTTTAPLRQVSAAQERINTQNAKARQAQAAAAQLANSFNIDDVQTGLMAAGLTPALGIVPDLINAGISGTRAIGNYAMGDTAAGNKHLLYTGINAASAVPGAGLGVAGAALTGRVGQALQGAAHASPAVHKGLHAAEFGVMGGHTYKLGDKALDSKADGGPTDKPKPGSLPTDKYTQWGTKVKQMSDRGRMPWEQVMQAQAARSREIYEYAKMAGHPYPEAVVAQFAQESGYGDAMSAANNTFGIKVDKDYLQRLDNAGIPYTIGDSVATDEVRNGVRGEEQARFVGFPDVQTNVRAYVEFMNQPRYREAMQAKTPQDYLMAVSRAGYASDPNYGPATIALMRDTNRRLNKYNFVYQPPVAQEPEVMRPDATVTALTPRPVEQLLPISGMEQLDATRNLMEGFAPVGVPLTGLEQVDAAKSFIGGFGARPKRQYGGKTPEYETEGGEVILSDPMMKPVAIGQGKYTKMNNGGQLYKANGPSHNNGGIPTAGGEGGYVFSDALKFDPTSILKMLR